MRRLLPLLAVFWAALPVCAQHAEPFVVPSVRETGRPAAYVLERESEERAGGQVVQSIRVRAPLRMRVEAVGEGVIHETWAYGALAVEVEGGVVGPRLGAGTAFGLLDSLVVFFESGAPGAPPRLLNPHAVRGAFLQAVRADEDRPGAFGDLQAVALREDFRARVADPRALADLVLDEPRLLHLVRGLRLVPGQTTTEAAERESPLTGSAVRTTVTVRLDSLSRDRGTAYVAWRAKADRDALVASLTRVLEQAAPGEIDPSFVADLAPTLLLEERATFAFDVATGLVRLMDYVKTARVAGRERIERARFRLTGAAGAATPSEAED